MKRLLGIILTAVLLGGVLAGCSANTAGTVPYPSADSPAYITQYDESNG